MSQSARISRLRDAMKQRGLDGYLVTHPLNVYYLTNFRATMWNVVQPLDDPEGSLLVEPQRLTFLCDGRYDPTPARAAGAEHAEVKSPGGLRKIAEIVADRTKNRVRRLGFEAGALLHADALALMEAIPHVEWTRADELLTEMRIRKDAEEQKLLEQAAAITDGAYAHALKNMTLGMSEHDLADVINSYLRKHSEGISFNTIVGFGATAAAPHYEPSYDRKLEKGHLVLMDCGSVYKGYMGDMTRMAVIGKATDKMKKLYAIVLEAQKAVLNGLRPNMRGHDADKLARDVFEKHGVLDKYLHGTGHGIGLAIHEPPRLKQTFENPLAPGTVFSVEPGLYEEGWGGIRIEDIVIMQESGPKNITHSPKDELIEVAC